MTEREATFGVASDPARRRLLQASLAGAITLATACGARVDEPSIEDITQIERMPVARELRPRSTDEIIAALHDWRGSVSIGGGRFSMGGQVSAQDSLHLDMRGTISTPIATRNAGRAH